MTLSTEFSFDQDTYGKAPAYKEIKRLPGTGALRIDQPVEFREDMYSLFFVAQVKPMYKHHIDG